jgi:hypothetical protein
MGSDYREQLQRYTNVSRSGAVGAADTGPITPIANRAGWTTYIQKIACNVTTSAAVTASFQAITANTPLFVLPSTPGVGDREIDFGPDGYALPAGEGLEIVLSGAGNAFAYAITAYQKLTPNTAIPLRTLEAS